MEMTLVCNKGGGKYNRGDGGKKKGGGSENKRLQVKREDGGKAKTRDTKATVCGSQAGKSRNQPHNGIPCHNIKEHGVGKNQR